MKVCKQDVSIPESFRPFNLTISVESREEAQALYAIFNYCPNIDLLPSALSISSLLKDYEISDGIIANKVTYDNFYRSKV